MSVVQYFEQAVSMQNTYLDTNDMSYNSLVHSYNWLVSSSPNVGYHAVCKGSIPIPGLAPYSYSTI